MTIAKPPTSSPLVQQLQRLPMPAVEDARGQLLPVEFAELPFVPQRVFTVSQVPTGDRRGEHSHFSCQQILVCIQGQIDVECRLGNEVDVIQLTPGADALYIPAGIWASQTYQSRDAVLLVICSEPWSENNYFKAVF